MQKTILLIVATPILLLQGASAGIAFVKGNWSKLPLDLLIMFVLVFIVVLATRAAKPKKTA